MADKSSITKINTCNIEHCDHCLSFLKKDKLAPKIDLSRSFTKIDNKLHLGFSNAQVCPILSSYKPGTTILAGNGAVEIADGGDCWNILKTQMRYEGLMGDGKFQEGEDALTWLAAYHDFFNRTINPSSELKLITEKKVKIIQSLQSYETVPRQLHCFLCKKYHSVPYSKDTLILTTNWDLGLFHKLPNVIQLHGRCDHPKEAILPLQNISSLMAQKKEDFEKLNCGILPGPFLEQCLRTTKYFIFWGVGLNDYDGVLWHFLRGFLTANPLVKLGIATKDDPKSIEKTQKKVLRFFPPLYPNDCFCSMLNNK